MRVRKPKVAGIFYEGEKEKLKEQIEKCFLHKIGPGKIPEKGEKERKTIGIISPHAGYIYSGPVACFGFSQIAKEKIPETVVIIGPNHRGIGKNLAVWKSGVWLTPLGEVKVDEELAEELLKKSEVLEEDERGHLSEHSIEVQIPFLQYIYGENFKILPISMLDQSLDVANILGDELSSVLKNRDALIIASSDFTHYETQKSAEYKDRKAIETIIEINPEKFYEIIQDLDISVCGPGPIATLLFTCKKLGCKNSKLLKYATSGEVSKDYFQVVGYASIEISK
jgi:AmmeMemoRadiSam system protein B